MKSPYEYHSVLESLKDDIIKDFKEFVISTGRKTLWIDKSVTEEYPSECFGMIEDMMSEDSYPIGTHYIDRHCGEVITGVVYGVFVDEYDCLNAIFSFEYDSSIEEVNIYDFDIIELRWIFDRIYSTYKM